MDEPRVAESSAYRTPTMLEGLGARVGRTPPSGSMRPTRCGPRTAWLCACAPAAA